MKRAIVKNMESRFLAYSEILDGCSEESLHAKLEVFRNKSLAEHLWCIVGARESYANAIEKGEWIGFSCSIQKMSKNNFAVALKESSLAVLTAIDAVGEWNEARTDLLLALNEHEVMHEGQIIRHMYGLGYQIPSTVKWS